MNIFKGKEELEKMNKSEVTNMMKDLIHPNRTKGGLYQVTKKLKNDNMPKQYSIEKVGTNMGEYRPRIDGKEYTWGELKKYPAPLLKVLAYRLWQQKNGSEEE